MNGRMGFAVVGALVLGSACWAGEPAAARKRLGVIGEYAQRYLENKGAVFDAITADDLSDNPCLPEVYP
jgi:hypothetical protein